MGSAAAAWAASAAFGPQAACRALETHMSWPHRHPVLTLRPHQESTLTALMLQVCMHNQKGSRWEAFLNFLLSAGFYHVFAFSLQKTQSLSFSGKRKAFPGNQMFIMVATVLFPAQCVLVLTTVPHFFFLTIYPGSFISFFIKKWANGLQKENSYQTDKCCYHKMFNKHLGSILKGLNSMNVENKTHNLKCKNVESF